MAKREFIVKKPFKFNGEAFRVKDRITLDDAGSDIAEARISFGLKWRFIIPLVAGKAVTQKDEMKGKHKDGVTPVKAPPAPKQDASPASESKPSATSRIADGIKNAFSSKGNGTHKGK